jgi:hypothetical protein
MLVSGFDETGQGRRSGSIALTFAGFLLLQWLAGPNQPEAAGPALFPDVSCVDGEVI